MSKSDLNSENLNKNGLKEMSASEALYSFFGWLTTQDQVVKIGSTVNATVICDLLAEFIQKNKLAEPSNDWRNKNIEVPEHTNVKMVEIFSVDDDRLKFYDIAKKSISYLDSVLYFNTSMVEDPFDDSGLRFNTILDWFISCRFVKEYTPSESENKKYRSFVSGDNIEFFIKMFGV